MPTCNRLTVPLTFKQFFSAVLLRIFPIQNFVPRTSLSLCDVRPKLLLGNNALQIQFGLAETRQSRSHRCTRYISAERRPVPATAEVPACGPAIAQFANPCHHGSTNRTQRSTAGSHGETSDF